MKEDWCQSNGGSSSTTNLSVETSHLIFEVSSVLKTSSLKLHENDVCLDLKAEGPIYRIKKRPNEYMSRPLELCCFLIILKTKSRNPKRSNVLFSANYTYMFKKSIKKGRNEYF